MQHKKNSLAETPSEKFPPIKLSGVTIQISVTRDHFTEATPTSAVASVDKSISNSADELLTMKEAVVVARLSASTLDRMKESGQLAYTRIGKKNIFFKRSDLLAVRKEVRLKGISF